MSSPVKQVAVANFPTRWGDFRIYGFEGNFQVQSGGLASEEANRLAREGKFPRPVKISQRASGWVESEVEAFNEQRIAASRPAPGAAA